MQMQIVLEELEDSLNRELSMFRTKELLKSMYNTKRCHKCFTESRHRQIVILRLSYALREQEVLHPFTPISKKQAENEDT